ncbi:MCE family protein [Aldersonia sp. NBC_00410]|uniref:MCE family protein n=1 Tax=Aldersonia sp. NBC_00410 TaxID=2975954 RepID=UPI002252A3D2|nr:MCE family protein [Aldersonia sp. NBC_00410]MCX5041655.1 MCE family protein [Aldersonia sp. NBC_00410]
MKTKLVRYQLIAFVVVAVLGIVYVGARYVRLDNLLGFGQYTVTVQMTTSGGLYPQSEITYRGVPVGRVGALRLTDDGLVVEAKLDNGGPDIPASTKAVVANRSAIGEQYLDLQPTTDEGPYLEDGSVITADNTTTPLPVEEVIRSVDSFARSVPLDDLRTTITELGTAFDGKGDDLQVLVDSLNSFTETGIETLPETLQLIRDGRIVLDTQAEQSDSIRAFSDGLDKVTAQLRDSDPDIRRLIGTGTDFSDQTYALLQESGPALTENLTNLNELTTAVAPKAFNLKPLLQLLPGLSIGGSSTAPGDGTTHFGLVLETNNPIACTRGYESTYEELRQLKAQNPDFDDTQDNFPFNTKAGCKVPQGNPTSVRGGARAIYSDPQVPQPWDDTPKTMPDTLNLSPAAEQLAVLLGVTPR